jgi:hypothetical protein
MAKQLILHCKPADAFYHPRLGLVICMELWEGSTLIRTLHVVAPCESEREARLMLFDFGLDARAQ